MTFSKELKEATKVSHSAAENTKFVAGFLRGVVDPEDYRKLIANFWYVYSTMERLIHDADDPTVKVLQGWQSQLDRKEALEKDLLYYYGPYWKEEVGPSPACDTYCFRLSELAQQDPYLLLAHHYTRYIGDLSGGQILCKIFPNIHDAKEWKTNYRAILDVLNLNESQKNAIFAEANYAFRLNMYMFDEIKSEDPYPALTAVRGFWKVITGFIRGK